MEIVNSTSSYPTVILTEVKIDCNTISEHDFINLIKDCLEESNKAYKELVIPKYTESINKQHAIDLERAINKAKLYAENKWKTEKRRSKYIREVENEHLKRYGNIINSINNISIPFFDFDGNFGTVNGINTKCIISNSSTEDDIRDCFNVLKITRYFSKAIGLRFMYEANKNTFTSVFRPQIELILPEEIERIASKERENLENCISSFYNSNNYNGD